MDHRDCVRPSRCLDLLRCRPLDDVGRAVGLLPCAVRRGATGRGFDSVNDGRPAPWSSRRGVADSFGEEGRHQLPAMRHLQRTAFRRLLCVLPPAGVVTTCLASRCLGARQLLDHALACPLPLLQEDQEIGHLLPVRPLVELPDEVGADLAGEVRTRRRSRRAAGPSASARRAASSQNTGARAYQRPGPEAGHATRTYVAVAGLHLVGEPSWLGCCGIQAEHISHYPSPRLGST